MLPPPTSRLRFREMTEDDLADVASLDLGGTRGPEGWIAWQRSNHEEHGFGLWVLETHDGRFVGDCGLTMQEVEGEWFVELGWHVRQDLRGRGYATEAAIAVRDAARAAGIEHLIAIIRPDNLPSQRVATKTGLVLERQVHKSGEPALVFALNGTDEADETKRLYGPWAERRPEDLVAIMSGYAGPWWIAGGWAIEAFTGVPRAHDDLDPSIPRADAGRLVRHVRGRLDVWQADKGTLRPLLDPDERAWLRGSLDLAHPGHPWAGHL